MIDHQITSPKYIITNPYLEPWRVFCMYLVTLFIQFSDTFFDGISISPEADMVYSELWHGTYFEIQAFLKVDRNTKVLSEQFSAKNGRIQYTHNNVLSLIVHTQI